MVNELIILLTDKQQAELIKRSEAAGVDDDHNFFQMHVNSWLDDSNRLEHTEK